MGKLIIIFSLFIFNSAYALTGFNLKTMEGEHYKSEHEMPYELVFFWATWCSECKDKLHNVLPGIDKNPKVKVLSINTDENIKRAKHYIKKNKIKVTVLRDDDKKLTSMLNVSAMPHWAVFKRTKFTWKLIDTQVAFDLDKVKAALQLSTL